MFDLLFPIIFLAVILLGVLGWGYWKLNSESKGGDE